MKNVGIIGHYDTNNFGDLLLAMLVESAIRDAGCNPIHLFGFGPNKGNALRKKIQGVGAAFRVDALVFGGGGYFEGRGRYSLVKHLPFYLATKIASLRGKKIGIFGTGAGPAIGPLGKALVPRIIAMADHVALRDQQSIAVAREIGVTKEIHQCVDLAQSIRKRGKFQVLFAKTPVSRTKTLLLHADTYFIGGSTTKEAGILVEALRRFEKPVGWEIVMLFDYLDSQSLAEEIERETGCKVKYGLGVEEVLRIIWESSAIVSTKFHVPLVSLTLDKPVWGISRHPKVKDLFAQYERTERYSKEMSDAYAFVNVLNQAVGTGADEKDRLKRSAQEEGATKLYDAIGAFCAGC